MTSSASSTAAKPTTSAPHWPCTWTSSTCSRACWPCWASPAAKGNKVTHRKKGLRALFSCPLEDGHGLHAGRIREHVHHACRSTAIARLVHQQARIARQCRGVAAHIDDAPRGRPPPPQFRLLVQVRQRLGQRKRAFARRVHQPALGYAIGNKLLRRHLEQVAGRESGRSER